MYHPEEASASQAKATSETFYVFWGLNHVCGQTSSIQECHEAAKLGGKNFSHTGRRYSQSGSLWLPPGIFIVQSAPEDCLLLLRFLLGEPSLKGYCHLKNYNSLRTRHCYSELRLVYVGWYPRRAILV